MTAILWAWLTCVVVVLVVAYRSGDQQDRDEGAYDVDMLARLREIKRHRRHRGGWSGRAS